MGGDFGCAQGLESMNKLFDKSACSLASGFVTAGRISLLNRSTVCIKKHLEALESAAYPLYRRTSHANPASPSARRRRRENGTPPSSASRSKRVTNSLGLMTAPFGSRCPDFDITDGSRVPTSSSLRGRRQWTATGPVRMLGVGPTFRKTTEQCHSV